MQLQKRVFRLERAQQSGDELEASFASETPVVRSWGTEVLVCTPEAVDLSRSIDGLPLLANHDARTLVGRARNLRVSSRKLRGTISLFDNEAGRDTKAVIDGGHREVSLSYEVLQTEDAGDGVFRVTRWRPYEISIVSIPADPTVGIQRSQRISFMDTNNQPSAGGNQAGAANEPPALTRSQRAAASASMEAFQDRATRIADLARRYSDRISAEEVQGAMQRNADAEGLQALVLERMTTRHTDTRGGIAPGDMPGTDPQQREWQRIAGGYSLQRALLSMVDPGHYSRSGGREAEMSQELARRSGIQPEGLMVPMESFFATQLARLAKRDFSVGVSSEGGVTVGTNIRPDLWTDLLLPRSAAIALGAKTLFGLSSNLQIPKKAAGTTPGWVTEQGELSESGAAFGGVTLSPKRAGAFMEVTKQLVIQSSLAIEQLLREDLTETLLSEVDRVTLVGTGASNQPRGIANTSGLGAVVGGTNGAQLAWSHVLDLEKAVANANGIVNPQAMGYAINPAAQSWAKRTPKIAGTDTLMIGDTPIDARGLTVLNGYKCAVSTHLPANGTKGTASGVCSTLLFGDFSQAIIGFFGNGVDLVVDPYSLAINGMIRITANLYVDVGVRRANSFATMADALTA
jgi:HK97 family phage major capsid protein/HK97 family phage prohead protease